MNKSTSAIIAVICTIISVGVMIYNSSAKNSIPMENENSGSYSLNLNKEIKGSRGLNVKDAEKESNIKNIQESERVNSVTVSENKQNEEVDITEDNKQKILSTAKKLSPIDYEKTIIYLNMENKREGVTQAFRLLKGRLTDSEYEKLKGLGDIYIR